MHTDVYICVCVCVCVSVCVLVIGIFTIAGSSSYKRNKDYLDLQSSKCLLSSPIQKICSKPQRVYENKHIA